MGNQSSIIDHMLLTSSDITGAIKKRQKQAANELADLGVKPRLAIVQTIDTPAINSYVAAKQRYGEEIGAAVDVHKIDQQKAAGLIERLNQNASVHGVIVQLPLADPVQTDELVGLVGPGKDVDALGNASPFDPPTPRAILLLLEGYDIDLTGKNIVIVGHGRLVGRPLARILKNRGLEPTVVDKDTADFASKLKAADVIITATGQPKSIDAEAVKEGAVIVDAGMAGEGGKTVGDVDQALYQRDDLKITPNPGGVGPMTVVALFDNLLEAASQQSS